MKHSFSAIYDNVRIRPLDINDIESLRIWRNDKSKTKFLRKIGTITPEMQKAWYENYLEDRVQIIFAIDEIKDLNRMVGSLAIYDMKEDSAEIGKIQIGDIEANGRGIGRKSLVMAMKIGFDILNLNKFVASVHQENISARTNDLKIGFRIVGQHNSEVGGIEDEIEITRGDLASANLYLEEIVIDKGDV